MFNSELEKELQNEIQLNLEKEKLKDTITTINSEINQYIIKRKKITEFIMNYRKKVLEEYKDDEDRVAEYFDHEKYVVEQEYKYIDRKLKELTILSSNPYFGKIDFEEDINDVYNIYIGRFGVTLEDTYDPLVVDWRAPVSALFYAGKLGDSSYISPDGEIKANILNKRQFIIKKGKLKGMFDSHVDVKDEILQMVLSSNSSNKLKDIVMTIQSEQDKLIRQPRNKTIVVDGVAGSGKTTIALHRIAYLLYNYRKILGDNVLILGPNNIFMEYISSVLPSLGESGVKQTTFKEFALDMICNLDSTDVMDSKEYMEGILNKDKEFIEKIIEKNSEEYINKLDDFIKSLDYKYFKIEDIKFFGKVIVTKNEIEEMFGNYFKNMCLFKRNKRIRGTIYSKIKDARDEIVRDIQKKYKETISKYSEEELNVYGNDLEFKRKLQIRNVISQVIKTKKDMKWLENEDVLNIYYRFNGSKELTQDDLAPILYLKVKLEELTTNHRAKHIVIDEAQDYSMLQFIVIKLLTKCKYYTVVGDSNQRIIPIKDKIPMEHLSKYFHDVENFHLTKSYRSTQQIMKYANKYICNDKIVPLVRDGKEVVEKVINTKEDLKENLIKVAKKLNNKEYENVAIICRNAYETKIVGEMLKKDVYIKVIDREENLYTSGEIVISSYFAKGLEFDAVILLDDIFDSVNYDKIMYVMATRALHELYVFKIQDKLMK